MQEAKFQRIYCRHMTIGGSRREALVSFIKMEPAQKIKFYLMWLTRVSTVASKSSIQMWAIIKDYAKPWFSQTELVDIVYHNRVFLGEGYAVDDIFGWLSDDSVECLLTGSPMAVNRVIKFMGLSL